TIQVPSREWNVCVPGWRSGVSRRCDAALARRSCWRRASASASGAATIRRSLACFPVPRARSRPIARSRSGAAFGGAAGARIVELAAPAVELASARGISLAATGLEEPGCDPAGRAQWLAPLAGTGRGRRGAFHAHCHVIVADPPLLVGRRAEARGLGAAARLHAQVAGAREAGEGAVRIGRRPAS